MIIRRRIVIKEWNSYHSVLSICHQQPLLAADNALVCLRNDSIQILQQVVFVAHTFTPRTSLVPDNQPPTANISETDRYQLTFVISATTA